MSLSTGYTVNNANYANKDLSQIFAPITTVVNYDIGIIDTYYDTSINNSTTYNYFKTSKGGGSALVDSTNNGIVDCSYNTVYGETRYSFLFLNKGIHRLDFSLSLTTAYYGDGTEYGPQMFLRFTDNPDEKSATKIPNFYGNAIYSMSNNGNSGKRPTGTVNSTTNDNLINVFETSASVPSPLPFEPYGYCVYRYYYDVEFGKPYFNMYFSSITVNIPETEEGYYTLYPQLYINYGGNPYGWNGNWMVTKLT